MSNLAYAPVPQWAPQREQPSRRVEIVTTRAQRRARPRPLYALIAIGGLFALFLAQLLMSIVVSDGAYQISALQTQQANLTRQQQSLGEQVDTLASTQNLAVKAEALGMVQSTALPAFLDVATGKVTGTSQSAQGAASGVLSTTGNLVPNALLKNAADGTPADGTADNTTDVAGTNGSLAGVTAATAVVDPTDPLTGAAEDPTASAIGTTAAGTSATGSTAGAPALATGTSPVASQGTLPIPVTR